MKPDSPSAHLPDRFRDSPSFRFFSVLTTWKGSLILFSLMIGMCLAYFFWQVRQLQNAFFKDSREHSATLARVIEQNARSAIVSQDSVEQIIRIFLGNTARFIDYLDTVAPFSSSELEEFAYENGLTGIRITRTSDSAAEGPADWTAHLSRSCDSVPGIRLEHSPDAHLYILRYSRMDAPGCVMLGLSASDIEKLKDRIGPRRLLETLSHLPGLRYVRIEKKADPMPHPPVGRGEADRKGEGGETAPEVRLKTVQGVRVAESRLNFSEGVLVVGLDSRHYWARTRQLRNEFLFFGAVLVLIGCFFSWLLHRSQAEYMNRMRAVNLELSRQREDAALGRAAAAIAHEIRNPLNAIGMGLQRIQMERPDLDSEYRNLVASMRDAVRRTNGIISGISRYTRPLRPRLRPVSLSETVRRIMALYEKKCADQGVEIIWEVMDEGRISGDPPLLEQMTENLVKNAVEAQPEGGFLRIRVESTESDVFLCMENRGFTLPPEETGRILDPYFTTKTRGTGLGLSIVRKIAEAHKGDIRIHRPARIQHPDIVQIEIRLRPCTAGS